MQKLNEDIKNNTFSNVYLLYGEEAWLRKQYRNKLKEALVDSADSMNYNSYEGKGINLAAVIDMAETMPFFSDKRVILIEDSGIFKNACDRMAEYITEVPATTYFIFSEAEIDKRGRLYKAVNKVGSVTEFTRQSEALLKKWVLGLLKKENKKITAASLDLFLSKTGDDMNHIERELEKLVCYTLGKEVVSEADIESICTEVTSNKIFEMISMMAGRRQKEALSLYYDLLTLKEPPMRILFLITRQFNLLMQVKELAKAGYDSKKIGEKTGLKTFVVGKYMAQAGKFTMEALKEAVISCAEMEELVKTGRMNDVLSVELLIVKYSCS